MLQNIVKKIVGTKHERELRRLQPLVVAINDREAEMAALSDDRLQAKTAEFRTKLDQGASLDDLLVPAFAACREAARRSVGMRHYDVQLIGGMVLHQGKIAEMKTGEGKTLVATLACYLNALEGKGVHVVTVNDYLATRDAEWMSQVYGFMGLSTGVIHPRQNNAQKKHAYRCDITYGQNNEYGFDYLRDNMKFSIYDYAQRPLNFAIVDEVDSILVDEARTPLIISGPGETASDKYREIDAVIPRLHKDEHYEIDEKSRQVTFTEEGVEAAQELLGSRGLIESRNLYDPVNLQSLHILQQCLRAHTLYKRDQHYMVSGSGEVLIIDEFTGRTLPGRRWSDGLHQAVEAKEHVAIQDENITLATISFQNLFRLYNKLSGMTGTADTEAGEFHKIYKLDVVVIPTNRPIARADNEDVIYKSEKAKFNAIAEEIEVRNAKGQPILVGTTSVEKSEALERVLERKNIAVNVLNAKQHEREAYVVAQAGRKGAITVATNMAGRGTDIILGGNPAMLARMEVMERLGAAALKADPESGGPSVTPEDIEAEVAKATTKYEEICKRERDEVLEAGGLFILGTERHESRRIDNQLRGRSGRQGDVGESRFYLSLEDDLMRIFAGERVQVMMDRLGMEEDVPIEHKWVTKAVENAQKKVEERNFDIRKNLLDYDDVMNQQRKSMYSLRRQVLMGQYRTVPTEEQAEKGMVSEPVVTEVNQELFDRAKPIVEDMVRHHATPLPEAPEQPDPNYRQEVEAAIAAAKGKPLSDFSSIRVPALERDIYLWFGCQVPLTDYENDPVGAFEHLKQEVGMSLTEQWERLLDLTDDLVANLIDEHCPPKKHFEDWNLKALGAQYHEYFGIDATGIEGIADRQSLAEKLYADAHAVLVRKSAEFGAESYLRLFRNVYMQEIDRRWIEHLQAMDNLRDGIGLRGYGQRDPKREYKREGYDLFQAMMVNVKNLVAESMFRAQRVTEEDLERQEAQRRQQTEARQRGMQASHRDRQGGGEEGDEGRAGPNRRQRRQMAKRQGAPLREGAEPGAAAPTPQTVRREKPKVGRNDPCWCGSGKKYKSCHYQEDRALEASGG
ncbi:MAG: preprotein translocase subunit SecA [Myxococcales bacterium]|nr:preprotein translocase subunit SecA [Myxococcales bacterium]